MELEDRIKAGMAWLDETVPNWEDKINLSTLDMQMGDKCVLGQLFGDWKDPVDSRGASGEAWSDEHGFSCFDLDQSNASLTDPWKEAIKERRSDNMNDALMASMGC